MKIWQIKDNKLTIGQNLAKMIMMHILKKEITEIIKSLLLKDLFKYSQPTSTMLDKKFQICDDFYRFYCISIKN